MKRSANVAQINPSMPDLEVYLNKFGFRPNAQLDEEYGNKNRSQMVMMYHEMGNSIVVGVNPNVVPRNYFIGIIGGSDGLEAEQNTLEFRAIGNPKTRYFTAEEIMAIDFSVFFDVPNSSPKAMLFLS